MSALMVLKSSPETEGRREGRKGKEKMIREGEAEGKLEDSGY